LRIIPCDSCDEGAGSKAQERTAETTSGRRAFRPRRRTNVYTMYEVRVRRRARRSSRRQLIRREPIVKHAGSAGPSSLAIGTKVVITMMQRYEYRTKHSIL